jgi:hypothetical protein
MGTQQLSETNEIFEVRNPFCWTCSLYRSLPARGLPEHSSCQALTTMLVGGFNPSEKYEFVSWDDDIPN